jgi:hypothetical protein
VRAPQVPASLYCGNLDYPTRSKGSTFSVTGLADGTVWLCVECRQGVPAAVLSKRGCPCGCPYDHCHDDGVLKGRGVTAFGPGHSGTREDPGGPDTRNSGGLRPGSCARCGQPVTRADATYCSGACRQAAYRARCAEVRP